MLWRKSWLETRWRFVIGLAILLCSAAAAVFTYPQIQKLLPLASNSVPGEIGRRIREAAELSRSFRGFVWAQWYRQNASQMLTLFAALIGTAGILRPSRGGLFTLSLPVSRGRLVATRGAAGLAELAVLAFVPSLVIPILSPAIGESYFVGDSLVHGLCLFTASAVFFELAFLFSMTFDDPWRPLLLTIGAAIAVALSAAISSSPLLGIFHLMSGETWFRGRGVPWAGLAASAAIAAALHWGAVRIFARHDF